MIPNFTNTKSPSFIMASRTLCDLTFPQKCLERGEYFLFPLSFFSFSSTLFSSLSYFIVDLFHNPSSRTKWNSEPGSVYWMKLGFFLWLNNFSLSHVSKRCIYDYFLSIISPKTTDMALNSICSSPSLSCYLSACPLYLPPVSLQQSPKRFSFHWPFPLFFSPSDFLEPELYF